MSSERPLFSVIMPIHNKAPHIVRAVESIWAQSCQDFEILMVDDASSDNSYGVMCSLTDPRIKIYRRSQPGPGGYAGRNLAMRHARGEWAAFLDADDEWLPDHLERFEALAITYPNARMLGAGWCSIDAITKENCRYYEAYAKEGNHQLSFATYFERCVTHHRRAVHTSAAAVRLDTLMTPDLFPAETGARRGGDVFAWARVLADYKEVAWSNHIGALYHVDSVNMVTKNAMSLPVLWRKESLEQLVGGLNTEERYWIGRYFNMSLLNGWVNNSLNGYPRVGFRKGLNKYAGMKNYLFLKMFMLLPSLAVKAIKRVKDSS